MKERLARIDARIYRVERAVVGIMFLLMALVVFGDVLHQIFSRVPGRLSVLLAGVLGTAPADLDRWVSPALIVLFVYTASYFALKTRAVDAAAFSRRRALVTAAGVTACLIGVVQAYVHLKPEGIVWAPYLSLSLLLWVGLLGCSMAAHAGRHLALEMGEKLWPSRARPMVRRLAQLATALFCALLVILGVMSTADYYELWTTNPLAGAVPSVDIPKWMVFLVLPYAFLMTAWRFLGRAFGLLADPPPPEIA